MRSSCAGRSPDKAASCNSPHRPRHGEQMALGALAVNNRIKVGELCEMLSQLLAAKREVQPAIGWKDSRPSCCAAFSIHATPTCAGFCGGLRCARPPPGRRALAGTSWAIKKNLNQRGAGCPQACSIHGGVYVARAKGVRNYSFALSI